jgi:methylmalonyl-CoA mutase
VLYAGRPGEREAALREAGVEQFVFAGMDAVEALERLHASLGVGSLEALLP